MAWPTEAYFTFPSFQFLYWSFLVEKWGCCHYCLLPPGVAQEQRVSKVKVRVKQCLACMRLGVQWHGESTSLGVPCHSPSSIQHIANWAGRFVSQAQLAWTRRLWLMDGLVQVMGWRLSTSLYSLHGVFPRQAKTFMWSNFLMVFRNYTMMPGLLRGMFGAPFVNTVCCLL